MKGVKKHLIVCLVMWVLAGAGLLIVRNVPGKSTGGTINGISWNVTASQLRYIGESTQRTESFHHYLIENGPFAIDVEYEFNHTVVNTDGTNTYNADGSIKQDVIEEFGPDVPASGYGEHSDTQGVSVANLENNMMYDITAYTRVSLFDGNDHLGDGQVDAVPVRFMKEL